MGGRVEIITGAERRRRWSEEEKLQLVAEACRPGHSVSQVARQRGINASQLFAWRRQALAKGLITDKSICTKLASSADVCAGGDRRGGSDGGCRRARAASTSTKRKCTNES